MQLEADASRRVTRAALSEARSDSTVEKEFSERNTKKVIKSKRLGFGFIFRGKTKNAPKMKTNPVELTSCY
jgi:hypothetical protein